MNPINFYKYIPFIFRKRFKKKYIVIESDDWGMELSISIDGINYIKKKYGIENFTRWTTDSLESVEDLSLLYDSQAQDSLKSNLLKIGVEITEKIYKESS